MLGSILPAVGGDRKTRARARWLGLATAHAAGSTLAAALLGAALTGIAGALPEAWPVESAAWAVAVAVAALYLPRSLGWADAPPLVQSCAQVPQAWSRRFRPATTAWLYGLSLGSGVYTRVMTPAYYLLWLLPFLAGGAAWAVGVWALYGLVRSGNVWLLAWQARPPSPMERATELSLGLASRTRWVRRLSAAALTLTVVALATGGGAS